MSSAEYPAFLRNLPSIDVPLPGVRGWLSQAADHQVVFLEIDEGQQVPDHSHGEQWGIVVEGEMELTIGGDTRRYRAGDSYHIPGGTVHSAKILSPFRAIDVFAEGDRYRPRSPSSS